MRIFAGIVALILLLVGVVGYTQTFYTLDSTEIAVFQRPFTGQLDVMTSPGTYWRLGSSVTEYKKRDLFSFDQKNKEDAGDPIKVRFNDGGHADISGNMSWEMPTDADHVIALHTEYRNHATVERQLVKNVVNQAMFKTSPMMSSTESYAARRTEFIQAFEDQLEGGAYKTESVDVKQPDPITGELKTVKIVNVLKDQDGSPIRAEESLLHRFGIRIQSPTITDIVYDKEVEDQIKKQRDNIMAIQTAQAEAKKAEQNALTAEKNGQAGAAEAKWKQEIIKAKEVTLADQNLTVAKIDAEREATVAKIAAERNLTVQTLAAKTADQYKLEQTLQGEGDAAKKKAIILADGALQQKLDAWLKSQQYWATAFSQYKGNVVPNIMTGSSGNTSSNGATDFMSLMAIKAAKDLALDLEVKK